VEEELILTTVPAPPTHPFLLDLAVTVSAIHSPISQGPESTMTQEALMKKPRHRARLSLLRTLEIRVRILDAPFET
jgi:hypothetical protein